MLEGKGLFTAEDLLGYAPFRYEDRTNVKTIAQLAPGEMATVIAEVSSAKSAKLRGRMALFEARFMDASRSVLIGKWFHGEERRVGVSFDTLKQFDRQLKLR